MSTHTSLSANWWKNVNCDVEEFHLYQQYEQQPLTSNHWTQKKTMIDGIGNPDLGFEQAWKCVEGGGMPTLPFDIWISNNNTNKKKQ